MKTSWNEVKQEISQLTNAYQDSYQLDAFGQFRIFPFSRSPGSSLASEFLEEDLPGVLAKILQQYNANRSLLKKLLGRNPSPAKEAAICEKLNTLLPSHIVGNLTNIAVGRHYDVYQVANFVVKIERYYGEVFFPSFEIWAHRWADSEDLLSPTQRPIYQEVENISNARIAVFRSATTQEFYGNVLAKRLPPEAYAHTDFALVQVGDFLLDTQIQPWEQGPTLFSMLKDRGVLHRMFSPAPHYSLKPKYDHLRQILKGELTKFLDFDRIDPYPPNFIFDTNRSKLVLVDIQEFSPVYAATNRAILKGIWDSW